MANTISSIPDNDRFERFVAASGQTSFPFDFPIYAATDLRVIRRRGYEDATLVVFTDYAVTGVGRQEGGTITLTTPANSGDVVTILSAQPMARTTQFVDGGDLPASALNAELNRIFIALQQVRHLTESAVRTPDGDSVATILPSAADRAGQLLGFDTSGNIIPVSAALGPALTTAFATMLLDDVDAATARGTLGISPTPSFRNKLINPDFSIALRRGEGVGLTVATYIEPANNTYVVDRWAVNYNGTGSSRNVSRIPFSPSDPAPGPDVIAYLRHWLFVAGTASVCAVYQPIERVGTLAGRRVTASLYIRAQAATTLASLALVQSFGSGGTPASQVGTIFPESAGAAITTDWQRLSFSVDVPPTTTKQIGTNGNDLVYFNINLPAQFVGTIDITGVQLEQGPVATPLEARPPAIEITLCQRFFYRLAGPLYLSGYADSAGRAMSQTVVFPSPMRAAATVSYTTYVGSNLSVQSWDVVTPDMGRFVAAAAVPGWFQTGLNGGTTFDAEL